MKYHIHKAVVIGSGTMGAAIAAHLANAGVPVTLLDIVPKDAPADDKTARNKIVHEGWDRCLKARPANLMSADLQALVKLGNLEDDFDAVAEADWICEAIVEDFANQAKFDGPHRRGAQAKCHCFDKHLRHFCPCDCGGPVQKFQETFSWSSFLQSAALFEITGDHSDERY
jgi:hypothetical protein